ncbi:MAG: 4Fe-4S binding protein [Methanosarcinales archaeon]
MEIDYTELKKGGFMRQVQKNRFSMRLRLAAGRLDADQLPKLAEIAKKYGDGHIHLTARQGIEIPYIHFKDIEKVKSELAEVGLYHGVCGPRVRTVVACQGSTICPHGLIDAQYIGKKIDEMYYGRELPHKFKFGVTGCPMACLKPSENDFGVMGGVEPIWIEDNCILCGLCEHVCREDAIKVEDSKVIFLREKCNLCGDCISSCPSDAWKENKSGYTILVGGKMGRHPQLGHKIVELVNEEKLFELIDKTLDFYDQYGEKGERFGETINRVGLDKFKEEVL